jgi:hypothetical protein
VNYHIYKKHVLIRNIEKLLPLTNTLPLLLSLTRTQTPSYYFFDEQKPPKKDTQSLSSTEEVLYPFHRSIPSLNPLKKRHQPKGELPTYPFPIPCHSQIVATAHTNIRNRLTKKTPKNARLRKTKPSPPRINRPTSSRRHLKPPLPPQLFQLIQLTRHFTQNVCHRTRLLEHAVPERPDHVSDCEGGDASLCSIMRLAENPLGTTSGE